MYIRPNVHPNIVWPTERSLKYKYSIKKSIMENTGVFLIEHLGFVVREEITDYLELEWHIILPIISKWMTFFPMISVFSTLMYKQKMYKIRKSNKHSVKLHFGLIDKSVPLIQNNRYSYLENANWASHV